MTTTTSPIAHRNSIPVAYAIVLPPPDGRNILLDPQLRRIGYGLWREGFVGEVVGLLVDSGGGTTDAAIRAACAVTVFDPVFRTSIDGCVTDHAWGEVDRIAADTARRLAAADHGVVS